MPVKAAPRTLAQFTKDERRKRCPVCQLPEDVRQQLRNLSDRKIRRETAWRWLVAEFFSRRPAQLPKEALDQHLNERHDA